jgi:hypothetical protein
LTGLRHSSQAAQRAGVPWSQVTVAGVAVKAEPASEAEPFALEAALDSPAGPFTLELVVVRDGSALRLAGTPWSWLPGSCEQWAHRDRSCGLSQLAPGDPRGREVAKCLEDLASPTEGGPTAARLQCMGRTSGDCDAFLHCSRLEFAVRDVAKAKAAAAAGDWTTVIQVCEGLVQGAAHPEQTETCADLTRQSFDRLLAAYSAGIDGSFDRDAAQKCRALKDVAARLDADRQAAVEAACREAAARSWTAGALASGREAPPAGLPFVPNACSRALDALAARGGPWAEQAAREVTEVCYLQLGVRALQIALAPKPRCAITTELILDTIDNHHIRSPQLDKLAARARKLCQTRR